MRNIVLFSADIFLYLSFFSFGYYSVLFYSAVVDRLVLADILRFFDISFVKPIDKFFLIC